MNALIFSWQKCLFAAALGLVLAGSAIGCSPSAAPSTEEEKKSFMGDASKMPADARAKINQQAQQNAARAAQAQQNAQRQAPPAKP